uniref:Uncharacterized protein n=1 Tax=Cacopsylla melanoneura TaxID=428564 RepID=A0A8D9A7A8_9HEMI
MAQLELCQYSFPPGQGTTRAVPVQDLPIPGHNLSCASNERGFFSAASIDVSLQGGFLLLPFHIILFTPLRLQRALDNVYTGCNSIRCIELHPVYTGYTHFYYSFLLFVIDRI